MCFSFYIQSAQKNGKEREDYGDGSQNRRGEGLVNVTKEKNIREVDEYGERKRYR